MSKKLPRIFRVSGKQSEKHFPPGRVPGGKYLSGCKCASCVPTAHKACAQQTAKNRRKAPKGIFDGLSPPPFRRWTFCFTGKYAGKGAPAPFPGLPWGILPPRSTAGLRPRLPASPNRRQSWAFPYRYPCDDFQDQ